MQVEMQGKSHRQVAESLCVCPSLEEKAPS